MNAIRSLIGTPWALPCTPPVSFDCWELVRHVRGLLGHSTPSHVPAADRTSATRRLIRTPPHRWQRIDQPVRGCVVRVGLSHVGVWLGGGDIVHTQRHHGTRVDKVTVVAMCDPVTFWELADA